MYKYTGKWEEVYLMKNPLHTEEENQFEYEQSKRGINPYWGKYSQKFAIKPIPYGNRNKQRFKEEVQSYFQSIQYYFVDEVKLHINLYLSEGRRYETPDSADLDNYAKLICDCLKGSKGILIDDIQIQHLSISWFDTVNEEYFEVAIQGRSDDFIMKDIEFYEMQNGMYYPISNKVWTTNGVKVFDEKLRMAGILCERLRLLGKVRHQMHQEGLQGETAYYEYMKYHPIIRGFNKNRVLESGYMLHTLADWQYESKG